MFYGCNIEGGCIIEVHNTLTVCTLGPNEVTLIEMLLLYGVTTFRGSTIMHTVPVMLIVAYHHTERLDPKTSHFLWSGIYHGRLGMFSCFL